MRVLILCLAAAAAAGCVFDSGGLVAGDATTVPDASAERATDDVVSDTAASDASDDMADGGFVDGSAPDHVRPDGQQPDSTQPDSTQPDSTQPDSTQPDSTQPDSTQPDSTQPDLTEPDLQSTDLNLGPLVIEAEDYDSKQPLDGQHDWVVASDVPGHSGTGFLVASPDLYDENCGTNHTSCGARADYSFSLPTARTHLHFRSYAEDGNTNSFAWGIDGAYEGYINFTTHSTWIYLTAAKSIAPGPHTLTLWVRESGNRVDLIVVSDSSTPPAIP